MNHLKVRWAMNMTALSGFFLGMGFMVIFLAMIAFESLVGGLIGVILCLFSWPAMMKGQQFGDELEKFINAQPRSKG